MKVRYVLRKDKKPNDFGEYGIMLYGVVNKVPVRKGMGIYIHPDFFKGDDGKSDNYIIGGEHGHPKADMYNKVLGRKKKEIDNLIFELENQENFEWTISLLRSVLDGTYNKVSDKEKGKVPFIEEVLKYNKGLYEKEKISYSVWHNIQNQMDNFRKYLERKKKMKSLNCCDLTVEIIEDYIEWRKERGNTNETINKSLTPIFKTVKRLIGVGWLKKEVGTEILELYLPTKSKSLADPNDGDVDYLSTEQVKKLISIVEKSKYPRTKDNFDLFLFSLNCGGLRFSDCCTLRWIEVNMEECMIKHLMVKNHTKRPVILNLPITSEAMKILKRWIGRFDNFVFGQLDDEFDLDDYKKLKLTLNSRNRTVNQSLQGIGEKIEPSLPFRLHHHIARHTFASWAINRGVDIKTISDLMAHSTSAVTEKIYAKLFPTTIRETVIEKLDFDLD